MVYLHEIICFAFDFETHLKVLNEVFSRLTEAGVVLSREESKFCLPSLLYLGFRVDERGLHVDISKVEAIMKLTVPKNSREIRRFIIITGWYRKFIPNLSTLIAPLTKLIQKNAPFVWTQDCEESFTKIKNILISAPILVLISLNPSHFKLMPQPMDWVQPLLRISMGREGYVFSFSVLDKIRTEL